MVNKIWKFIALYLENLTSDNINVLFVGNFMIGKCRNFVIYHSLEYTPKNYAMKNFRTGPYSHTQKLILNTITLTCRLCVRDKQAEAAAHIWSSQSVNFASKCTTCNAILTTHHSLGMFCVCCCSHKIKTSQFSSQLLHISQILLQTKLDFNYMLS